MGYTIAIAGTGYVGLSLSVLLAQRHTVRALDIVGEKVAKINQRQSPIEDAELETLLQDPGLCLTATVSPQEAYTGADFVVVATPTNYAPRLNFFDTSSVENVIADVLEISPGATVVIKSTIPIGFTQAISARYPKATILFSPEFLREGHALYDNMHPSRIVMGFAPDNAHAKERAQVFYTILAEAALSKDVPVLFTSPSEAEAIKLFSNGYLAMRIAFFNELDTYAEAQGFNARQIIEGVSLDPRIGMYYNNPSFGYGGYCLPKDTRQLLASYGDIPHDIIAATIEANGKRKEYIVGRLVERVSSLPGQAPTIGIYRLVMKSGSDNFRHSAIIDIMGLLEKKGIQMIVYEPTVQAPSILGHPLVGSLAEFKARSDLVLANRYHEELSDILSKVYSRDVFMRD